MKSHLLLFCLILLAAPAFALPPLEAYGLDARISDMELSPNGNLYAYTLRQDDERIIVVASLKDGILRTFGATNDRLRGYRFIGNDHLIVRKSITTHFPGYSGKYEFYAAFAANIKTGKSQQLFKNTSGLVWPQLHLDRVIGPAKKSGHVLMQARTGDIYENSTNDVYRVNMKTGRGKRIHRGHQSTWDWYVDQDENVRAREDFSNHYNRHRLRIKKGGKWQDLFKDKSKIPTASFSGLTPDQKHLGFIADAPSGQNHAFYHLSLEDGSMSEPVFHKENADIDQILLDDTGRVYGVRYSGFYPSYDFYDQQLTEQIAQIVSQFNGDSVSIMQKSQDGSKVLIHVAGHNSSGEFLLFDRESHALKRIAHQRPDIAASEVASLVTLNIKASDGLEIPTILTFPPGNSDPQNLPAVMLPHGGPESYDQVGFDYMAQYFASLGYLVIQPNFRGSTGFGYLHKHAGRGEWGKKMQSDLSDTLTYVLEAGVVDPDRVCIVGGSYGGYAALAGGAFTPELYKCVAAIAPVSDIPLMLNDETRDYGKNHWVVEYWSRVIGDRREQREELKAVSPRYFAERFQAPVLLIHGEDDTTVPWKQSVRMRNALQSAKKEVELIRLKDEDHYMSSERTRLQALTAVGEFLQKHLNP